MADLAKLVADWQAAYRAYSDAYNANRFVAADAPHAAARIAPTYRRVAWLWRQLAAQESAEWWTKAAALHAAELFDHQAELNEQIAVGGKVAAGRHLQTPVKTEELSGEQP